ncbi:hypothetical protein ACLOJK_020431 [Asimina triloba]
MAGTCQSIKCSSSNASSRRKKKKAITSYPDRSLPQGGPISALDLSFPAGSFPDLTVRPAGPTEDLLFSWIEPSEGRHAMPFRPLRRRPPSLGAEDVFSCSRQGVAGGGGCTGSPKQERKAKSFIPGGGEKRKGASRSLQLPHLPFPEPVLQRMQQKKNVA